MNHVFLFISLIIALSFMEGCISTVSMIDKNEMSNFTPFGVCYAKVTPDQIRNYEMVIIEPDHYSKIEIDALKQSGVKIIAYITLGEIDSNRWYFPLLEERGFKGKNDNWGSYYLDLSDQMTQSILLERAFPEVMSKGVDGLFLDTIDAVAPYTERSDMQEPMLDLIKGLRAKFPNTIIIQNAGLFLLNRSKDVIDAVLMEDIASGYDFNENEYYIKDNGKFEERFSLIEQASIESDLPFFIVDFAESESSIKEIRSRLDRLNMPYFISDIQLSKLPQNPLKVANKLKEMK